MQYRYVNEGSNNENNVDKIIDGNNCYLDDYATDNVIYINNSNATNGNDNYIETLIYPKNNGHDSNINKKKYNKDQ